MMGLTGLVAFAGGAGFAPLSAFLAAIALGTALFWHPDPLLSTRMERVWLPLATLLVLRALFHVVVIQDDVVIPVVDLLLLLMCAEALRSLDAPNDVRLYWLSFALLLAATAYRPGIVFLVAFVGYVGLTTLALLVGHLRREAERHGIREVPLGRGLVITTTALSGVILMIALIVFVSFPRVSQGWAGRGETFVTSIAGFSDQVSIGEHGSTILANPEIVLRVEFPQGVPEDLGGLHWRGRSYDRFDGMRWTRSGRVPPSSGTTRWYRERWTGPVIEQRIFGAPLDVRVLFALHPVIDIDPDNGIAPIFDNVGDHTYWGSAGPAYTAYSRPGSPTAEALRDAEDGFMPSTRHFTRLPDLDPRIEQLADSLTAGIEARYDKAMAIQRYLQSFEYTRDLPATARQATLPYFLFNRQAGHCEYFSTAMVVMLRTLGIHSRNVNGFLGGQWSQFGDYLVVTQNEAHSWVEVWFPNNGWVTFDPTPAGAGSTAALNAFWPGRIFFDGLQHRWNKWVLDYSVDDQSGLLARWAGLLGRQDQGAESADTSAPGGPNPLGGAIFVLVMVAGYFWARRAGTDVTPPTRAYLQLRESALRAGLGVSPGMTPLALVERVRDRKAIAGRAAERVVDLYLRARYGNETLGESDLREMSEALGVARKTLRARA